MSVPKVWSRFTSKTKDGTVLKFRIEEMTDDKGDEVMDLLMNHFVTEEPTYRAAGVPQNPEAMKETRELLNELYIANKNHNTDVCVLDEDTEADNLVVGVSVMFLSKQEDLKEGLYTTLLTKESETLSKIIKSQYSDVIDKFDEETFYDDRGLVVMPKYRGLGIAQEFFKARRITCKEHGVPLTTAFVTSLGSQKAAKRDGWETAYEWKYDEFEKQMGVVFDGVPESCLFMIARVPLS